jgi:hypothetical protein
MIFSKGGTSNGVLYAEKNGLGLSATTTGLFLQPDKAIPANPHINNSL